MRDLLIRGADLLARGRSDLLIRNGRFVEPSEVDGDADRLDADGLIALPGLVDLHTHLREPGREDVETVEYTHLHPDHVGWNLEQQDGGYRPTFPRARYLAHRADWETFQRPHM